MKPPAKDVRAAVALYESFREKKPKRIDVLNIRVPRMVVHIGYLEAVDYRTTHDDKLALYKHTFAPGSRPLLCVSADGRQLLLLGGRYQFTERGIVDKDAKGREIENKKHGKAINPKIVTLTQVQERAIAYLLAARYPQQIRTRRAAARIVRDYCTAHQYSEADASACVKDMFDMYKLERAAQ